MHIYFSGVGGVGIGPLALLALDMGYSVAGSDTNASDMTQLLEKRGVSVVIGQDGSQIAAAQMAQPIDWFVYSTALPEDHPELLFAQKHAIKISKRAEFLKYIISEKDLKMIAVAGTHGKTTTTGMLIWLFKQLNIPLSYSIGTTISFGPPAQYQAESEYFVYEADEFDKNFLEFQPHLSLIVSMDYDHPDTYPTPQLYVAAFQQFIEQSETCVTWRSIGEQLGEHKQLQILSDDLDYSEVTLAGNHTRQNAWLAATAISKLNLVNENEATWGDLIQEVNNFPGTTRRFEKLADNLYSDYAHHPVEIAATVEMAKEINQSVVVVYQPHQNIRQQELLKEDGYKNCFNGAEHVYWLPTYLSREYQNIELLSSDKLIASLDDPQLAEPSKMDDKLWSMIDKHRAEGSLVLCLSAGNLDHWLREQLANQ